ncbi:MAG: HEAT repeat domain-containing protein [Nitrospira sp.]|nr:HEAT repeat domain-containing protein [Nitrospira sp.]
MPNESEKVLFDTRLLSDAIIELNIARRNVAVYPKGHPTVNQSLNRAFDLLQQLFIMRPEITFAIAKDTIIIDEYSLDKKNVTFREFALYLNSLDIAAVTFTNGLTIEELYEFNKILPGKPKGTSPEEIQKELQEKLIHIKVAFIDYDAFALKEGETESESSKMSLWEQYIYALMKGTIQAETTPDMMQEIPPKALAHIVNRAVPDTPGEDVSDRFTRSYIRWSSERSLTSKDLKRIMDFIHGLRPELKNQFLSSAVKIVTKDIDSAKDALQDMPVDKVIDLLTIINEQKITIPEMFRNLLDKLSQPDQEDHAIVYGSSLAVDDIFLFPDVAEIIRGGKFGSYVNEGYQKEIQKLMAFDASSLVQKEMNEISQACGDELLEKDFCHVVLELIASDLITGDEYEYFMNILKEQTNQFIGTGWYGEVVKILKVLEKNVQEKRLLDMSSSALQYFHSPEFIFLLIDSYRTIGRLMREEALLLCDYYDIEIIPYLMDTLIDEESPTVRKFLISLITHFGNKAIPEALRRLRDKRWFVTRNMLYILGELGGEEVLQHMRSYCHHENLKVSCEAIKYLLKVGDSYGIKILKNCLNSDKGEIVDHAIGVSGTFRVKEVVHDLLQMLRKKDRSGAGFYNKIPVVRALGQIGDPRAIEVLRDLISEKRIIFKGAIEELKEEIYRTLKNYPYVDIKDLIEAGLKSGNERIREESQRLKRLAK